MLDILKRIGKNGKQSDNIPFSMIGPWFETKMGETPLADDVSAVFTDMSDLLTALTLSIRNINSEKLSKDIPETHLPVIEQNKKEYVSKLKFFIDQITQEKKRY